MTITKHIEDKPCKFGSPGVPMYGYKMRFLNEESGTLCGLNEKDVLVIEGPLLPGCMQTIYDDDRRFVDTYWATDSQKSGRPLYSTFDWDIRDEDGYYLIFGRTDDIINVAGHRSGTREIEENISSYLDVSDVAMVCIEDRLKGQVTVVFVIPKIVANTAEASHCTARPR